MERLLELQCIGQSDIVSTDDGFTFVTKSLSDILSEKNITHMAIVKDKYNMVESCGSSKNTIVNPGKGVCINPIKRRSDLICAIDIFDEYDRYYPAYTGKSLKIDVVFGEIGAPYGNVKKRLPVARINGYEDYKGTYIQNISLIRLAKAGILKKSDI